LVEGKELSVHPKEVLQVNILDKFSDFLIKARKIAENSFELVINAIWSWDKLTHLDNLCYEILPNTEL
jgi:hypothetical protein